jgi:glutamine synthetase
MSIYTGDYVGSLVDCLINGKKFIKIGPVQKKIGIDYLPDREADDSDRNRTSPVAFTGNKFEFRAVGSSQSAAISNTMLNVLMADSFFYFAEEIKDKKQKGATVEQAIRAVSIEALKKHQRIIFNGNGYSKEWPIKAKELGLQNHISTADILEAVKTEENASLFERLSVFTRREFDSFVISDVENYLMTLQLESEALIQLSNRFIIPAAIEYQNDLLRNADSVPKEIKSNLKSLIESAYNSTNGVKEALKNMLATEDINASAKIGASQVKSKMVELRKYLDLLEENVGQKYWPIPTYQEILLTRHKVKNASE